MKKTINSAKNKKTAIKKPFVKRAVTRSKTSKRTITHSENRKKTVSKKTKAINAKNTISNRFDTNVKPGDILHTNDKYFQGSDGFSKNRETVVVGKNQLGHVATVKLTTREHINTGEISNYSKRSHFERRNLYTKDNKHNPITVSYSKQVDKFNKFIKSNFPNIPEESVEIILNTVLSDPKYGKRNQNRLEKLKKRK